MRGYALLSPSNSLEASEFHAGGTTSAANAGKSLPAIAQHGRWAGGSPIVAGYIHDEEGWGANAMRGTGL